MAAAKTTLGGVDVGNPKRATAHPTAERLRDALQGLTRTGKARIQGRQALSWRLCSWVGEDIV